VNRIIQIATKNPDDDRSPYDMRKSMDNHVDARDMDQRGLLRGSLFVDVEQGPSR
jgi:hypothetical protein